MHGKNSLSGKYRKMRINELQKRKRGCEGHLPTGGEVRGIDQCLEPERK
jgi:hypothetical protein